MRAAIITPVESSAAYLARFTDDSDLPRYSGGSAPTLALSRPSQCSLTLRPARSADPLRGLSIEVLQIIRRLLIRSDRFRLEREFAGPDFHRGERCALPRHTEQSSREFASADPAAGAQDAAVQEPGFSPEIPVNACRRLQHLQRPTSSHFSSNAPRTSGCGDGHMADRRRSSLKIPDRRRFALAPWQCDNPLTGPPQQLDVGRGFGYGLHRYWKCDMAAPSENSGAASEIVQR